MVIKLFPEFRNVHAIAVPLPGRSNLITTNIFAVGKSFITLIDTGIKSLGALDNIRKELARSGLDFNAIERIIITHGHMDHFGLAASICEAVGHPVECFIHEEDKTLISSDDYLKEMWSGEAEKLMIMAGMPQEEMARVRERFATFRDIGDPLDNACALRGGEEFRGDDYQLNVIHTPGHTPGSCCIYEAGNKVLFSGDTIIKHITPNPLVVIKREQLHNPHYQSLKAFMDSLDRLYHLDVVCALPGHGEYVEDVKGIIDSYKTHYEERKKLVCRSLERKTRPLYEMIEDIFPFVPEGDAFLAVSEILVQVEILIAEGKAQLLDCGPPALYKLL
jgi:glyoxylase-like metal-dependent hydrolase (beta-lactamase superfamily II)